MSISLFPCAQAGPILPLLRARLQNQYFQGVHCNTLKYIATSQTIVFTQFVVFLD